MSKTIKGPKRTYTYTKQDRPDGRGSRRGVSIYKRKGGAGSKRKSR
jgi:hypothetical protein